MIFNKYNTAFLSELEKLNPLQKIAVTQIEGPTLVVAGPGTGKTHILASRIGKILMDTDTQAYNILCLTFTDAGARAMRERLLQIIGPEAHRVHIYTFHSFCNTIIRDNLEYFGKHNLEPISELERVEIIREMMDTLPNTNILARGRLNIYFYENHLFELFKQMKKENWTANFISEKIDEYLTELPNNKDYIYAVNTKNAKKGDLKLHKINDEIEKMEKLRAAAELFPDYIRCLSNANRYDFEDMITWVIRAFEENENLLLNYQERYLYFLVDEYQDTNGAQNTVLQKLISYWDSPNVFIVGDDDQSIFEFQGARLKNLINFYNTYQSDLQLVVLKENYRSTQHILNASKVLIEKNEHRIVNAVSPNIEKLLIAKNTKLIKSKVLPQVIEYPNRLHEETDLLAQIEALQKKGERLDDIAIIFAKHKQAKNIIRLLEKKGIPYTVKQKVNLLDLPLIQNILVFFEYINKEYTVPYSGEFLLYKILYFDFFKISNNDLAQLSKDMVVKKQAGIPVFWRDMLKETTIQEAFLNLSNLIEELISEQANKTIPLLFEKFINRSGLLRFILLSDEKTLLLQILSNFSDFLSTECEKNPRLTMPRLLDIFKNMEANNISIPMAKNMEAKNGVNLVTAHSAKGLEFRHVFIIDAVKEAWEEGNANQYKFKLPDNITFSREEDALEARRRLFYVAMTRAKLHLHISYSLQDYNEKSLTKTVFLNEISTEKIHFLQKKLPEAQLIETQILFLTENARPRIVEQERAFIDDLLKKFTLSISSLNRYLRCPLAFYYEDIMRVPTQDSEIAAFGAAMHYALMRLFDKMKMNRNKEFPNLETFLTFFMEDMVRRQNSFSKKDYSRYVARGKENLTSFYQKNVQNWQKNVQIEFEIRNVELNGVPITGVLDKIEILNELGQVNIVDYKTNELDNKKLQKPTLEKPQGGSYWRQMAFYKILYEKAKTNASVTNTTLQSLQPNRDGIFEQKNIQFSTEQIDNFIKLIEATYENIKNHQFYEGCGESTCQWCNFIKKNAIIDTFINEEQEELDD